MPATIESYTPQAVYPNTGRNFAPVAGLKVLDSNHFHPHPLTETLKKKYKEYKERDDEAYTEFCDTGRMIANLRLGKLLLMRSIRDGRYLFVKRDGKFSDNKTVGGQFQFYSTKLTAEWLSSRPERDPVCPSDDDRIEEFISAVKVVQDYYDRKFFDSRYEELESLSAQDYGTWITRFRFDPDIQDIVCELLDFPACRWDIRYRAEESPYFIYESKCSTAKLGHLLDAEIPEGGDEDHYGLRLIEQIARQGSNVTGAGKEFPYGTYTQVKGECIVTEMWLRPEEYCDIKLDKSEKTVSGDTLTDLLETFPNGLCAVGINGMQTLIGLYDENHKDHIVSGLYHVQSFSGVGKGISDAVDVMKELNDLHSQLLAHTKAHATPGFGYNSNMVTEQQARDIGKPRKNIALDYSQAPDGVRSINDVVQPILPGNPASSAFEFREQLKNDLQMAMQVTDFSNGLPGVDNKTATGAQIGDANAEMILVPQHLNKADHRKRADAVIYNLFKKYVEKPKFFAVNSKNGITKGKYISGAEFEGIDIEFEVVANSEVPQTPYQQRNAMGQVLQFTGGLQGLIESVQVDPEITGEIVTAFGGKLSIPKREEIARVVRMRIEQAKKMLETELPLRRSMAMVTGVPPENIAVSIIDRLVPPISSKEPYHQQKIMWIAELLDADEMMYAPFELRQVLAEMITRHIQEDALNKIEVGQAQDVSNIMANLPSLLGQQMLGAVQQSQNQAQVEDQRAADMQSRQMEAEAQDVQEMVKHERTKELNEQNFQQQLMLKGADAALAPTA